MMDKLRKQIKRDYHKLRPELPNLHLANSLEPDFPRRNQKKYGRIRGIEVGATFADRRACASAGVHAVVFPGIHGSKEYGAYSVCLSGGYEDDQDDGESFVYTGTGGQEDSFHGLNKQVKDQTFKNQSNASLMRSAVNKRPVRVVRGPNRRSKWAPRKHYRYDGLYLVEKAYLATGVGGHKVCKFQFRRQLGQPPLPVNPAYSENNLDGV